MLLAWADLIDRTAYEPRDPGVARLKLDWWRNELAALENGGARHPLMIALLTEGLDACARPGMMRIIDAAERFVIQPTLVSDAQFAEHCRASHGNLFDVFGALQRPSPSGSTACVDAGAYCAAIERIRQIGSAPQRLPADLNVDRLRGVSVSERAARFEALLDALAFDTENLSALPDLARRLTALAAAIHAKMRRNGYPVLDIPVDRPPIAHLWTAWRCR